MGTLMIDFITSLDGYASAEGWPGFWGLEGPEYLGWLGEQPDHTVLLGARTYQLMSSSPATGEEDVDQLTQMSKVFFSSTLQAPLAWANTRLVGGDAVEAVRTMKETGTRKLRTLGSLSLSRALITAGLVDRFRVVVFPVVTGVTGRERIYDGYPDPALDLVESRTFDGRLQLLEFAPTVLTDRRAAASRPDPPGPLRMGVRLAVQLGSRPSSSESSWAETDAGWRQG